MTFKALRPKDYSENPHTLGAHLKKRRRELGLLQREAAERMDILTETFANWEKDKTEPVAAQFRPVVTFLGYDPFPQPITLAERMDTKRRALGVTLEQVSKYLGWDPDSLTCYLDGGWRLPAERAVVLERFLNLDVRAAHVVQAIPKRPRRGAG